VMRHVRGVRKICERTPFRLGDVARRSDLNRLVDRRHVVKDEMPRAAVERLDLREPHVGRPEPDLLGEDPSRSIVRMLETHEEVVRQEPACFTVVPRRVPVADEQNVIAGDDRHVRHELAGHRPSSLARFARLRRARGRRATRGRSPSTDRR
jgi:hypothetical protein